MVVSWYFSNKKRLDCQQRYVNGQPNHSTVILIAYDSLKNSNRSITILIADDGPLQHYKQDVHVLAVCRLDMTTETFLYIDR